MSVMTLKPRRALVAAIFSTVALTGFGNNAHAQTGTGPIWVDTSGNVIGPALFSNLFSNREILLKIPSVGNIALPVDTVVYPTVIGDPIRWKYSFNQTYVALPAIVMSFESADCSGQGYLSLGTSLSFQHPALLLEAGNTVVVAQFFDSVHHWLVVGAYPSIDPPPHFNSQLVQGSPLFPPPLLGPGAFCQTVDVDQGGGPVVPVTRVIDQATLASPPMILQ